MLGDTLMAYDSSDPFDRIPRVLDSINDILGDIRNILHDIEDFLLWQHLEGDENEGETEAE